jgi:glutamate racemase
MVMSEDEKLKELQDLLAILETKEEIVEVNLPELVRLIENNEITPEEFEETFKKRFKDILA